MAYPTVFLSVIYACQCLLFLSQADVAYLLHFVVYDFLHTTFLLPNLIYMIPAILSMVGTVDMPTTKTLLNDL